MSHGVEDRMAGQLRSQGPMPEPGAVVESMQRRVTAGIGSGFSERVSGMSYTDADGAQSSIIGWASRLMGMSSEADRGLDDAEVGQKLMHERVDMQQAPGPVLDAPAGASTGYLDAPPEIEAEEMQFQYPPSPMMRRQYLTLLRK